MIHFPNSITEIQDDCALRFDGWAYVETRGAGYFPEMTKTFAASLRLFPREPDNFAVFFAFQRSLGKWGGEHDTKDSRSHYAFDLLFLHLYTKRVPAEYEFEAYMIRWNRRSLEEIEDAATYVRNSFRRL